MDGRDGWDGTDGEMHIKKTAAFSSAFQDQFKKN